MNKINLILEDNQEKVFSIMHHYVQSIFKKPIIFFTKQQDAVFTVEAIMNHAAEAMPIFTLYLDNELVPGGGSGSSFLNWMIDSLPSQIEKVIVCSYRDSARKEMTELCHENLIATELLPLPFAAG